MKNPSLQSAINQSYDAEAAGYDSLPGHGIDEKEVVLWRADILPFTNLPVGATVLDVGAGTGVFSRLWAEWGSTVTCLEPSPMMLAQARANLSVFSEQKNASFALGDTHQTDLFPDGAFDFIVSRQVVCYFRDPLLAFQNWHNWLKPGGQVVIVDGLWFRDGWKDDDLVDQLPISCLQTRATLAYLLEKSGFQVCHNRWLEQVNAYLIDTGQTNAPRYMIVAQKD